MGVYGGRRPLTRRPSLLSLVHEVLAVGPSVLRSVRSYSYGQPVHKTHPELLHSDEITVGITAREYWQRRQALARLMIPGSVAVLPASSTTFMAGIIPYPYRQNPDLLYCTGLLQPAVAVIQAADSTTEDSNASGQSSEIMPRSRLILFLEPPNPDKDRWDGNRLDREAALEIFGAEDVHYISEMPRKLTQYCLSALSGGHGSIYFDINNTSSFNHAALSTLIKKALSSSFNAAEAAAADDKQLMMSSQQSSLMPLRPLMHELRLIKSSAEKVLMQRSAATAAAGLIRCMKRSKPGVGEWQLASEFEHACKMAGAQRLSYPSVVASGTDAYYTHYGRNDKIMGDGDLVLMDAGCELNGYASDVTRTWPVNGRFSGPQADVYDIVLDVHRRCVEACRPGCSIRELHTLSTQLISEGVRDLGLLGSSSSADYILNSRKYSQFYWHSVSHYLGMDTHDTHLISHGRPLSEGSIITIEPGLYIPDEERFGAYRGIGVRIEDDVLVTAEGCQILSQAVPSARSDIEHLVIAARLE
ncbi:hypothetical protein CEUSTIGMA_g6087.t1 [Chlamydomonas eustigma]|uniref:Aminopeptidase P N-terminal domain-containing protein n=1 Tax=Chlamydomonas eustigma TaxID=1157962 RepID=A0A250X6W1_9CHLO|nr:hypothetical protein CEUSTIGMA_g6087.t1 [Chlamydomonas eustigma]|eukprot:GAX78649.1 hypothetical protein CEUSTIGMA_g6087.t1 [Chlamydomonas eustigma]